MADRTPSPRRRPSHDIPRRITASTAAAVLAIMLFFHAPESVAAQEPALPTPKPVQDTLPKPAQTPAQDTIPKPAQDTVAKPAPTPTPTTKPKPVKPLRSPWSGTIQANGTAFFGTSDQRVVGAKGSLARTDSTVELATSAQVVYGDAKRTGERRHVAKRVLLGTLSADLRPHASLSPFVLFTIETNLEKKIEGRYSISIGAKQTLVRSEQTETSLSAAILDEYTVPFAIAEPVLSTRLTRWSFRGRVRHEFDDRLRASHTTFWMPSARTSARYLVRSTSEAQYALTSIVNLTASVHVNYDSEAMTRGAPVNHDGQVLFGVGARW